MHPEFNFIFDFYQKELKTEIQTVLSVKASKDSKLKLHPFVRSLYWQKWQEDKGKKKEKESKG